MIELTYTTAVEILDGLVEEFGDDYVYPRGENGKCDYVRDGKPSCIVGHVLAKVGVPIERLEVADAGVFGCGVSAFGLLSALHAEYVLRFDGSVRNLLTEAQCRQDGSAPWGEAVKQAKFYTQS